MISINKINKSYQNRQILKDVSLNANKNDIICILGKTGQGKTTLFNIISNIEVIDSGTITNSYEHRDIEFVFQEDTLLPWRTVKENILLNLELKFIELDDSYYSKILNELQLNGYEDYFPYKLSGGTKRKVSIARSLICKPKLLILDEPFNGLDFIVKSEIENLLKELTKNNDIEIILYSSHLLESSIVFATKLFVLNIDEGLKELNIENSLKESITNNIKNLRDLEIYK